MNFLRKDSKRLPFEIICIFFVSFFYLFLSNLFFLDNTFIFSLTPLVFSIYFKYHLKISFFELYLFVFGFVSDILSQKMLGTTSFLNLVLFYIFGNLNKKAHKNQSFLYSITILAIYTLYEIFIYKFGFYSYDAIIPQQYSMYFMIFIFNLCIISYVYFFRKQKKKNNLQVKRI